MNTFATQIYRPGWSPDTAAIRLDDDEYTLRVPGVIELLDIAAAYQWPRLLPGSLIPDDAQRMERHLADPDHALTARSLHVIAQPVGAYLYGWPFFSAARVLRMVRVYEPMFRCWAVVNMSRSVDGLSAVDWVSAGVAWRLSMEHKEAERNAAWAELTIPGRLSVDAPGVSPVWMQT